MSIEDKLKHAVRSDQFVRNVKALAAASVVIFVFATLVCLILYLGRKDNNYLGLGVVILLLGLYGSAHVSSIVEMYKPVVDPKEIEHLHLLALKHEPIALWVSEAVASNNTFRRRDLFAAATQSLLIAQHDNTQRALGNLQEDFVRRVI